MPRKSFLISLALLAGFTIASAQTAPLKPLPTEPLEKYDDPPAPLPLWGTGVSPGMISQFDTFTSYQVNVDANGMNITGDAANEPSISVDPTNRSKMVIGWRQFNSVTSNFRQGGWGYTSDGGTSWTFPGVLENNVFRSDPVLGSDDTGRFFYLSLSLSQSYFTTMWRSVDGGQTFTNIGPATGGDKQWFVVDNTTSIGHGFQYQFWDTATAYGTREFSRSTDGGFTWMDPINIPNSPQWGTPDVDSNGNLFFGGVTTSLTQFWCIRSTNAKNGAVTPSFDQSTAVNLGGVIDYQDTINPGGLIGQVFLAVDRSGTSTNNNVYMMASVQPTGFNTGSDVMFVRSTNGGLTFNTPRRVNDDPVNHSKWHWMGTLSVAPNGRIDSVWLDTRNAANNTDSQLFYSYSFDGGSTWAPNVQVSNSFNPFLGYPNQNKMGDYMTIVSDNTGGNVAYAATFNLEEDIYYVRVAPMAPVAQSAVSRKTHGGAGDFYVYLPLTGTEGVECRRGGGASFDQHQVIVTFGASVTVGGVTVTSPDGGSASATQSVVGAIVTVNLTGVTDQHNYAVTLTNVNDGVNMGNVAIPIGILRGDVNGDRVVNSGDSQATKNRSGQGTDGTNFRFDVNTDGVINSGDSTAVKNASGDFLP